MNRCIVSFRLLVVCLACSGVSCSERSSTRPGNQSANRKAESSGPTVINVEDDNPEMLKAISEARRTLPEFWKAFEQRQTGDSDFSLKVKIEDDQAAEHIWLTGIERTGDEVFGKLGNDPDSLKNLKLGDRLKIDQRNVS